MTETQTALPDDAWGPDTRRVLARIDDSLANTEPTAAEYAALLAYAAQTEG